MTSGGFLVPGTGLEPARPIKVKGFSYQLRLSSLPPFTWRDLWSGLSLYHTTQFAWLRHRLLSLYTFPEIHRDLARDCHL